MLPSSGSLLEGVSKSPIHVAVAVDCSSAHLTIARGLQQYPDIKVLCCRSLEEITAGYLEQTRPDILLLSIQTVNPNVMRFIQRIQSEQHAPKILVLSACDDVDVVLPVVMLGTVGYILHDDDPTTLVESIRLANRGVICFSTRIIAYITKVIDKKRQTEVAATEQLERSKGDSFAPLSQSILTRREWDVLRYLLQGKTNQEIANTLALSKGSIQNYVSSIYQKLGVSSRVELIVWGVQQGLSDSF